MPEPAGRGVRELGQQLELGGAVVGGRHHLAHQQRVPGVDDAARARRQPVLLAGGLPGRRSDGREDQARAVDAAVHHAILLAVGELARRGRELLAEEPHVLQAQDERLVAAPARRAGLRRQQLAPVGAEPLPRRPAQREVARLHLAAGHDVAAVGRDEVGDAAHAEEVAVHGDAAGVEALGAVESQPKGGEQRGHARVRGQRLQAGVLPGALVAQAEERARARLLGSHEEVQEGVLELEPVAVGLLLQEERRRRLRLRGRDHQELPGLGVVRALAEVRDQQQRGLDAVRLQRQALANSALRVLESVELDLVRGDHVVAVPDLLVPAPGGDALPVPLDGLLGLVLAVVGLSEVEDIALGRGLLREAPQQQPLVALELVLLAAAVAEVLDPRDGRGHRRRVGARPVFVRQALAAPGLGQPQQPGVVVAEVAQPLQQLHALQGVLGQHGAQLLQRAAEAHVGVEHQRVAPLELPAELL